jgi:hypothetical protein
MIMRILAIFSALILILCVPPSCKQHEGKKNRGNAVITFEQMNHDYGEIPFMGDGGCEFVFQNTGKTPLVLTHVKSTCGCTIPVWPKEPVKAGEQDVIRVSYDTKRVGTFVKSVYVYSNANNGVQRLYIRGKVNPLSKAEIN